MSLWRGSEGVIPELLLILLDCVWFILQRLIMHDMCAYKRIIRRINVTEGFVMGVFPRYSLYSLSACGLILKVLIMHDISAYERMVRVYCIYLNINPLHNWNNPLTNPTMYMYTSAHERMVHVYCIHINITPLNN